MFNLDRTQQYLLLGLVVILVLGMSLVYWRQIAPTRQANEAHKNAILINTENDTETVALNDPEPSKIIIHVAGAVQKSGVYHLCEGDRVIDAIAIAGGASEEADLDALNLAQPIIDGQRVWVPKVGEQGEGPQSTNYDQSSDSGKVNINTGDTNQLQKLNGIGPAMAQRIIDYRANNGPFKQIEDIKQVSGIGDKRFEQLKEHITVY